MLPNLKVPQHIMPLSDDQLFELCSSNSELVIERNSVGELTIMSPAGGLTGNRNSILLNAVYNWNEQHKTGYVFDSSTGFILPDGSMLSPDVSWIANKRWKGLTKEQQERFPPLCPDFVLELRSPSDEPKYLQGKMDAWIKNGCRLAWLIDPQQKKAFIFQPGVTTTEVSFTSSLVGEDVLPNFSFQLSKLI